MLLEGGKSVSIRVEEQLSQRTGGLTNQGSINIPCTPLSTSNKKAPKAEPNFTSPHVSLPSIVINQALAKRPTVVQVATLELPAMLPQPSLNTMMIPINSGRGFKMRVPSVLPEPNKSASSTHMSESLRMCHSGLAIQVGGCAFLTLPDLTRRSGHSWESQKTRNPKKNLKV